MALDKHRLRRGVQGSLLLGAIAVVAGLLLAYTHDKTRGLIADNELQYRLRRLNALIPRDEYDNDLATDTVRITNEQYLGTKQPVTAYLARANGAPVAAIIESVAPNGYGGPIRLMVGVYYDGTLAGVRVLSHRETPGLGDKIDLEHSDWIERFAGLSLAGTTTQDWALKDNGGMFDQFTGASMTPRAVVQAVHNTLLYFSQNRDDLFAQRAPEKSEGTAE